MRYLLALDPGVNLTGWALFEDGVLQECGHDGNLQVSAKIHSVLPMTRAKYPLQIVIERPRTYKGQSAKGDTMDLLDLSCEVGFFCGVAHARGVPFTVVLPQEWKGQTPKKVTQNQLARTLTPDEWDRVPKLAKKYLHNVLDAVAIGCRVLERRMAPLPD